MPDLASAAFTGTWSIGGPEQYNVAVWQQGTEIIVVASLQVLPPEVLIPPMGGFSEEGQTVGTRENMRTAGRTVVNVLDDVCARVQLRKTRDDASAVRASELAAEVAALTSR